MTAQLKVLDPGDARLPQRGDVVADKYRIDGFIARGGMGAVLAATHVVTGRRVALKWVLPDADQDAEATHRIVREARAAARVRHPNVVDVYDVGEHDGSLFLVMELLEGQTLHARLKAEGALDVSTALALLVPALRAVEAAHASDVIHRDLKPSNIFLCRDSEHGEVTPRVLDFGISKIVAGSGDGERSLTRTGAVLGTPHYMAPEQLTGDDADARADVYALGVILYQCLTGRLPFQDANYNALVLQIATVTPVPVAELAPQVPPALSAVVMRAMAREPEARYPTVSALIAALLPFAHGAAAATGATTGASTGPRLAWIALALCVLGALAVWASRRSAEQAEHNAPPVVAAPADPAPSVVLPEPTPVVPRDTPPAPTVAQPVAPAPQAVEPAPASQTGRERARSRRPAPAQEEARPATPVPVQPPEPPHAPKRPVPISLEQF